jgi:UDP:flavonoid glycosyltransferase YjiC (YdhE family)
MRVLFIAAGTSPASVFAIAPLATAVRNAGHDILVAAFDELTPSIEAVGLPPVSVVSHATTDSIKTMNRPLGTIEFPFTPEKELPFLGGWFGRQAAVSLDGLLKVSRDWHPDLVVGGTLAYATSLLSASLEIPHVRQAWDWVSFTAAHPYANEELQPELALVGLAQLTDPDLFLDICPPSLKLPHAPEGSAMRWIPGNKQRKLEPWMYTKGDRPRVCVTIGSFRTEQPEMFDYLCDLVDQIKKIDVELVVAASEPAAAELRARHPDVRSGWVPLEFLAPTCDAIVHHNGGLTAMNAMNAGLPQVILSRFEAFDESLRLLTEQGSSIVLHRGEDTAENAAKACEAILADGLYAERAGLVSDEIKSMPPPPEMIGLLEKLVTG